MQTITRTIKLPILADDLDQRIVLDADGQILFAAEPTISHGLVRFINDSAADMAICSLTFDYELDPDVHLADLATDFENLDVEFVGANFR